MPDILKLIESTKLTLAQVLDMELYQPVKEELRQYDITHSLEVKKEQFKNRMEEVLNELKVELVRSIVEEASEKSKYEKYEMIFLKAGQAGRIIDLQEGDIPISYQTYLSMCSGRASEMVQEIVVLRPVG
ncbi:MAG: hypothetical protein V1854_00280 [Methanobacteriota archaeon]